jgi:hemolysin activation/secretion protein
MRRSRNGQIPVPRARDRWRAARWAGAVIGLGLAASPAAGQSVSQIEQAVAGQNTILQRFTPPPRVGSVEISVEDQRRRVSDREAENRRFRLRSLTLEGADTLPPAALEPLWRDRIGAEISLADLYRVAEAIDEAYLRAGYFSMTIVPVQDFTSGRVTLRVYESYVTSVKITSAIPGIEQRLAPYIARIVAMSPIRIKEAERILSLMSDLAGLEIEGRFIRPEIPSGGGALELDVGFDRWSGMIGLDNLGSEAVGPLELSGAVAFNDLLGLFETTNLVAVTVPDAPSEMALLQLTQDIPIGHDGLSAGYGFTYIDQRPDIDGLDIAVKTRIATASLRYPFIRTLDHNLFGQIEINARNDDVDVAGAPGQQSRARWLVASLSYDRALDLGAIAAGFGLGQGLGGERARPAVPEDYRFATADLDYNRPLGELTTLRIRAKGQYASTPLPAATQFSVGGDPYGWAFDGGSLAGDSGAAAAIEISRAVETGFPRLPGLSITGIADYGVAWNNDARADYARDTLGSIGIGVSGMVSDRVTFQVLAATPWTTGEYVDDPGTRVFFRIGLPL